MKQPILYFQTIFKSGGIPSSIFSLVANTLGTGILGLPYCVMMNGYILGPILIIIGAYFSYYTAMLIVKCSEVSKGSRYEDIALYIYG